MRRTVVVVLSLGMFACVREEKLVDRFVEQYCEARWACGCESPGLTQVHCESTLTRVGEDAQDAAQEAGLAYDRECANAWLEALDESCGVQPEPAGMRECGEPCPPYHGEKAKGQACQSVGAWSDCARNLRCGTAGLCEDPCDGQREGDSCDFDVGGQCGPGLVCGDGVCVPEPALGEPCWSECRVGAACDHAQEVCVEAAGFGESCNQLTCGRNLQCTPQDDGTRVCDVAPAKVCALGTPW